MVITDAELNRIRKDAAIALDIPCVIQRKHVTQADGFGSVIETWPAISPDGLKCGLSEPTGGQLQNYDYLIASIAAWQVKLPYGTDIQHQDRIVIDTQYGTQTLVVQVVLEPRSYAALLTVLAGELK